MIYPTLNNPYNSEAIASQEFITKKFYFIISVNKE